MGRRLYSLFERPRNAPKGSLWKRISHLALTKSSAISVFQSQLIGMFFDRPDTVVELRPVKDTTIQVS